MTQAFQITLHKDLNESLRQQWQTLFASLAQKSLFQHIAWQEAFLASRYSANTHGQLLIAVATQQQRPVAIVPLLYRTERRHGLPVRLLELLHRTDMGVRDLPIAADVDAKALFDTLLRDALPAAGYPWDIFELNDVVENSSLHAVADAITWPKIPTYDHDSNRLRCGSQRSACFEQVSKSHVKKTKRKRKNLDALGKVECELITEPAALPDALNVFIELENSGWKGTEKTSLHYDLPQKAFYESLIANPTPELNCCIAIMRLGDRPIAANLCTRTGDTLWMLKITYADDLNDYSPGNLMLLYLLEEFTQANGFNYISFITGGEWTHRWHPERQPVHQYQVFNSTIISFFTRMLARAKNTAQGIKYKLLALNKRTDQTTNNADNEQ